MDDATAFARLIQALRPWLGHLVIVGGWAYRLYRLHPLAGKPGYRPLRTRDVDVALSLRAPVHGDIQEALKEARFTPEFRGTDTPPITRYGPRDEDTGFYSEFLVPLHGGGRKRDGRPDVTASKAGINVQKLRHIDLLLVAPFSVRIGPETEIPFDQPLDVLVANPVSFIVQKLLIHEKRPRLKKAQDVLYIHDTLELFGAGLDELRMLWVQQLRPSMPRKTARRAVETARRLFEQVTDTIREAARIPPDRRLTPDNIRDACDYGLREVLVA